MTANAGNDAFGPPRAPVLVRCLHGSRQYMSNRMVLEARGDVDQKLWYCATPTCDGAGFKFDIFPARHPIVADIKVVADSATSARL